MALCEHCGSIQIVRVPSNSTDRLFALVSAKRPFLCRRCGWRGRRYWSDEELKGLRDYGVGGAENDPSLTVLDQPTVLAKKKRRTKAATRRTRTAETRVEIDAEKFDFGHFDPEAGEIVRPDLEMPPNGISKRDRGKVRNARKRSQRREVLAAVAATALIMFVVVVLGLAGSCVSGGI